MPWRLLAACFVPAMLVMQAESSSAIVISTVAFAGGGALWLLVLGAGGLLGR